MRTSLISVCAAAIALACAALPRAQSAACAACLAARYWHVDKDDYKKTDGPPVFPEEAFVKDRPSIGLAFSGGGTRSAAATLGALRGLNRNGWLGHVRYVSAVSGGSWASVPFVFSTLTLDEFLGTVEDFKAPADADAFLKTPNGALGQAIADSSFAASAALEGGALAAQANKDKGGFALTAFLQLTNQLRREPDRIDKTYTRLIGKAFIDKLITPGAATSDQRFSWDHRSLEDIPDASRTKLGNMLLAHTERPFLIASGTMVVTHDDGSFPLLMPVEYTPLYVGVRQTFGALGGGYVEPWAYDPLDVAGATKTAGHSWTGVLDVKFDPSRQFTLADVAASSGAAPELLTITGGPVPEDYRSYVQEGAQVFPHFRHIGIQSDSAAKATGEDLLAHADGGASDNLGVMPLLARQTKNVLVFINTNNKAWATNDDLRSLFVSIGPPTSDGDRRYNAVLEDPEGATHPDKDAYTQVITAFDRAAQNKTPFVFCGKNWTVRSNEHYNIRGYVGLNICFLYNAQPADWAGGLPATVQAALAKQKNFPWFATFEENKPHVIQLKAVQVNLLANMWAWTVTQPAIVRMIRDAIADTAPLLPCPAGMQCP